MKARRNCCKRSTSRDWSWRSAPGDAGSVRGIRRTVHTLKGDSAACGFRELSELAHELEDVLKPELAVSSRGALAELVLSAADKFDAMLAAYRGNMQPPKADPLRAMIARLLKEARRRKCLEAGTHPGLSVDRIRPAGDGEAVATGDQVYSIALAIDRNCPMRAAAFGMMLNVLSECGTVLARHPEEIPPMRPLDNRGSGHRHATAIERDSANVLDSDRSSRTS